MTRLANETTTGKVCDECGRGIEKAHRRYKGLLYCAACYKRLFKKRVCPRCGKVARLPVVSPEAVCASCEQLAPCARCGREGRPLGMMTPYGPVCNSCAPFFRKAEPCAMCGELSSRLSRYPAAGIEIPICPKCAAPYLKGSCQACGRNRKLYDAPDGRRLCRRCLEKGEILCGTCGRSMPAGLGTKCRECSFREALKRRVHFNKAAFLTERMASLYDEFATWLDEESGAHKAFLSIGRFLAFFMEMEKNWACVPSYEKLLARFGAEGLRRVNLPMRWLELRHGLVVDATAREADSERRRIAATLDSLPEGVGKDALTEYADTLMEKVGKGRSLLRSVRLALAPAAELLRSSKNGALPCPEDLNRLLLDKPGQRAAISGFVNFLNKKHSIGLRCVIDYEKKRRNGQISAEKELLRLMLTPPRTETCEDFKRKWLNYSLAFFHELSLDTRKLGNEDIFEHGDGSFTVHFKDKEYWIPGWRASER